MTPPACGTIVSHTTRNHDTVFPALSLYLYVCIYLYIICAAHKRRKGKEENAAAFYMNKLPTTILPPSVISSPLAVKHCYLPFCQSWALPERMMGNFSHVKAVSLPLSVHIELLFLCV